MASRLEQLESTVESLVQELAALDKRLSALESRGPVSQMPAHAMPVEIAPQPVAVDNMSLANVATQIGRILLIFGGAYFLRALTDLNVLPAGTGVPLGATYALLWMVMAYRISGWPQKRWTAQFYAIASVLLALPLLYEAATRFDLLSGTQAALVLTAFYLVSMSVTVARQLRIPAWLVTFGSMLTALALLRATQTVTPYVVFLLFLAASTLWTVYIRAWKGLQWLGAIAANLGIGVIALLSTSERWAVNPTVVHVLAIGLLLLYLLSFAVRTHLHRQTIGWFEAVQSIFALVVAYAAVFTVVAAGQFDLTWLGASSVVLGAGAFALASTPETRAKRGLNFYFYSTLGLALIVSGSALLMSAGAAAILWSLMAVFMAWSSGRFGQVFMSLQCTLLLIAAGISSGVLMIGIQALAGSGLDYWPSPDALHLIVAAATVICLFIPVAHHSDRWGRLAELPQLIVLALSVWEVGGLFVAYLAPLVTHVPGPDVDLGLLAALRTAVLALAAVTLSLSSRHRRWPEARWLAYPLLALVGLKLLAEDFPHGRPLTLFIALGIVGGALIAVARLLRAERSAANGSDPHSAPAP